MDWSIKPHAGAGELSFGMDLANVEALLGPRRKSGSRRDWTRYEFRTSGGPILAYDDRGPGEINFGPRFGPGLTLDGHDIFAGGARKFLTFVSAADSGS